MDELEVWIMANEQELKEELTAMAERGEPRPDPGTILGLALELFTEVQS